MQPSEAARHVGISVNTVRAWTADPDYREFFSPSAQGGDGRNRDITDTDLRLLNYLKKIKRDGLVGGEVVATLIEARRRGLDNLPLPRPNEAVVPTAVIPRQAADEQVIAERRMIARLEQDIAEYKARLERSEADREDYLRKLIAAETELKMWRDGWRPPMGDDPSMSGNANEGRG